MSPKTMDQFCLNREQIAAEFRKPHIISGYREPYMSAWDSMCSVFVPYCNETFNVWSHLLFAVYFCSKFWSLFSTEFNPLDPFMWPLLSFAIGIIGFCLMSAVAHTFSSMSPYCINLCFRMDYAAISIYCVAASQAFYFYARPLDIEMPFGVSAELFLVVSLFNSLLATFLCCISETRWCHLQALFRVLAYASNGLFASSPALYRYFFCTTMFDCDYRGVLLFVAFTTVLLLGVITYVLEIPERFFEGWFDFLGSSHNIMHMCTAIGANIKFEYIKREMLRRQNRLVKENVQSNFYNSILIMVLAFLFNIVFCLLLKTKTGKCDTKKCK